MFPPILVELMLDSKFRAEQRTIKLTARVRLSESAWHMWILDICAFGIFVFCILLTVHVSSFESAMSFVFMPFWRSFQGCVVFREVFKNPSNGKILLRGYPPLPP